MVASAQASLCALKNESSDQHDGHARRLRRRRCCPCSSSRYLLDRLLLRWRRCRRIRSLFPWRGFLVQRYCFISCCTLVLIAGRPGSCLTTHAVASYPAMSTLIGSDTTAGVSECRYVLMSCRTALELLQMMTWPYRQIYHVPCTGFVPGTSMLTSCLMLYSTSGLALGTNLYV